MFTGELAESRQTEVTIRDIDEVAMELLIDFCYTSHIVVEEGNVQTLLPAGKVELVNVSIAGTWWMHVDDLHSQKIKIFNPFGEWVLINLSACVAPI